MCVCIYVCMCAYMYAFTYTYTYIYIYTYVHMCVCAWIFVCVCMCKCVCVHICVHLHRYIQILYVFIYLYIYMCAKYSDFLCIWLRKYDFLTEKLGIGRIRIRNDLFRIRILQKVPDPTGSGSTTLLGSFVTTKDFRVYFVPVLFKALVYMYC
jgi:hypothetical protein